MSIMTAEALDRIIVAINLGTSHISGIMATKQGGQISILESHQVPSNGVIQHGCIHNVMETYQIVEQIIDVFSRSLPEGDLISGVYVGVDCQSMHSRRFSSQIKLEGEEGEIITEEHLTRLKQQALEARYAGMEVLRISDPRYYLDGSRESRPVGVRCRHLEAVYQLILVRRNVVQNIHAVFNKFDNLKIHGILASPLAEAAVTLTHEEGMLGCAYVNIGAGTTSVSIYERSQLSALYVIPLGGGNVTRDLCDLKIVEEVAERIKIDHGSMNLDVDRDAIVNIPHSDKVLRLIDINRYISARMMEIMGSVINVIKKANPSEHEPSMMILSGGASCTRGFITSAEGARLGGVRRDVLSDSVPASLRNLQTEIGLVYQATEGCISRPAPKVKELETLFDEQQPEPTTAENPEDEAEDLHEYLEHDNTLSGIPTVLDQEDEDQEDYEDEEDEQVATKRQDSEGRRGIGGIFNKIMAKVQKTFDNINGNGEND